MVLSITQTKQVFQGTYKERHTPNLSPQITQRIPSNILCISGFLPPAIRRMGEGNSFSLFTFRGGGVPGLRFSGGAQVSDFRGGSMVSDFPGGGQVSDFQGGSRSQIFGGGSQISDFQGGSQVSDFRGGIWSQIFRGVPSLSKGKNF